VKEIGKQIVRRANFILELSLACAYISILWLRERGAFSEIKKNHK
jgi:hypothetical protein